MMDVTDQRCPRCRETGFAEIYMTREGDAVGCDLCLSAVEWWDYLVHYAPRRDPEAEARSEKLREQLEGDNT